MAANDPALLFDIAFDGQPPMGRHDLADGCPRAMIASKPQLIFDHIQDVVSRHRYKQMGVGALLVLLDHNRIRYDNFRPKTGPAAKIPASPG
ncbi:MAG: hypothetical protein COX20_03145 [Desulfobacterales bacterium CG23_combo_of_CG06-09_8_20_14_all_52_9]|nr:MAG: hypothetical protein COX20_03145 [Desulfobacterales bacterium CG23_combo_of_CG06-09_8_20_14_all_52_9]